MMHTANLENCKKLYELSGWKPKDFDSSSYKYPDYPLGYLLRKLPQNSWVGYTDMSNTRGYAQAYTYAWNKEGNDMQKVAEVRADTPEDCAALLAIKLIEEGVINVEAS